MLDLYGRDEIIFLGPDERTAHLMNWAALYAKRRKYPFWRASTTGKSPEIGGIPHDQFGMTTAGIHEYVLAVLEKLNLKEEQITKIQTGGGEDFRNKFHLHPLARADLFVPCGGRPSAININNWDKLLDEKGNPKFRIIVEGANLFITEEARLRLEEHGILVIKDASANKGGVTSSSLEVYASLALSDEEYERHMMVKDGEPSAFRKAYVAETLATIRRNARLEFDLLWREHETRSLSFTTLSNMVSKMINDVTDAVNASDLPKNEVLKKKVLLEYTPKPLLELVGIDRIIERVPPDYLNAIVATKIATNYVYTYGLGANAVDFFNYMKSLITPPG